MEFERRRRNKQVLPLKTRLENAARECRKTAQALRPGTQREILLRAARRYEATADLAEWLSSSARRDP
jgi:hypothetical protein